MGVWRKKINSIILTAINLVQYPLMEIVYFRRRIYVFCFCNRILNITKKNNIGDDLNLDFLEVIFRKKIIKPEFRLFKRQNTYSFIGSILEYVCGQESIVTVWGTGFKRNENDLDPCSINKNNYLAVRGPLTRDIIIKAGGQCPEIYGDPGILLSRFYKVNRCIKYKIGIIPHNTELNSESVNNLLSIEGFVLLDIVHYSSLKDFLELLNSCEYILSSSLHGIIMADSYNIPNLWVRFSSRIDGDGFKYMDYYLGAKKGDAKCFDLSKGFSEEEWVHLKIGRFLS